MPLTWRSARQCLVALLVAYMAMTAWIVGSSSPRQDVQFNRHAAALINGCTVIFFFMVVDTEEWIADGANFFNGNDHPDNDDDNLDDPNDGDDNLGDANDGEGDRSSASLISNPSYLSLESSGSSTMREQPQCPICGHRPRCPTCGR